VKDRLPAAFADVHEHAVVLEPGLPRGLGDEVEHPLRLLGRELGHVAKRIDVPLRQDEQMNLRLRMDVPNRDEAVGGPEVVAVADEPAEEAALTQRGSPPR
jgi:hypothetical protein